MTTEERYLNGGYALENPMWDDAHTPWKAARIADLLREHNLSPSSICDVGCGAGGVLANLAAAFPQSTLIGYELSPFAIEKAQALHPTIHVVHGSPTEGDTQYDLALLIDVFEHVEDYLGFLRSLRGIAKNFVFHIPLDMNAGMVLRDYPILELRRTVGHLHSFSKSTALATLADAGYSVISSRYTASNIDLPNRTLKMRLAKWPRRAAFHFSPDAAVRVLGGYSLLVLAESTS